MRGPRDLCCSPAAELWRTSMGAMSIPCKPVSLAQMLLCVDGGSVNPVSQIVNYPKYKK